MSIYYLYVKTHKKSGLKYLGYTGSSDPHKYLGSGLHWKRHLKVHGTDIHTEIIRECKTLSEIRKWGLYYSELWHVVESDAWANLKEEAGDGWTSEQSKQLNHERIVAGTHNLLGENNPNHKRVAEGTHHFQGNSNPCHKRVAEGTHHFQGDSNPSRKRVAEGTHHWLGPETNRKRVENGTHHFLDREAARARSNKRLENGTHNFSGENHPAKIPWTCEHCGRSGRGKGQFTQWHANGICLKRQASSSAT